LTSLFIGATNHFVMPKKPHNSFKRALAEATVKLALAMKQRAAAQKRVIELDAEIPALQQTIQALQSQLGKKGVMPSDALHKGHETLSAVTGEHRAETSAIPPELVKWVGPQDLTGMGSILPNAGETQRELTEEEFLDLGDVK
jgi:hypothetical protein